MTAADRIAATLAHVIAERIAQGLGLAVYGMPLRDGPFDCYAKDAAQRDQWIAKYEAKGLRVEIIGQAS